MWLILDEGPAATRQAGLRVGPHDGADAAVVSPYATIPSPT